MKSIVCLALAALLCGCKSVYINSEPRPAVFSRTSHTVVNNTTHLLDVYQDGTLIARDLEPGSLCPVRPSFFSSRAVVVVTAHQLNGAHVGSASWTFLWNIPEAWTITGVQGAGR